MFVPAWVLLGVAAYMAWTVFQWAFCTTGGESLRGQEIGYEKAVLDFLHRAAGWLRRHTAALLAG